MKFINWNLKLGVNFINLYDPFSILKQEKYEHFKNLITLIYSKKFNNGDSEIIKGTYDKNNLINNTNSYLKDIIIIYKNEFYNVTECQKLDRNNSFESGYVKCSVKSNLKINDDTKNNNSNDKEYKKNDLNLLKEKIRFQKNNFFVINIIDYKDSNIDLMGLDKIKNYDIDHSLGLIDFSLFEMEFEKNNKKNAEDFALYNIDYRYLTRKEKNYLPEIIINFAKSELSMFGFPFLLMENSEIM